MALCRFTRPWPVRFQQRSLRSASSRKPSHCVEAVASGAPRRRPARPTSSLKVEAGGNAACRARFSSGWRGSFTQACHCSVSRPVMKRLGANPGWLSRTSTSPVFTSSATTAPARSPSARAAACCRRASSASRTRWPMTGGMRLNTSTRRPCASTSSYCAPGLPCSLSSNSRSTPLRPTFSVGRTPARTSSGPASER